MEQLMPRRKKHTQRDYTLGFKLAIVDQVEKGELTYNDAQLRYGIQGRITALTRLRKHGKLDYDCYQNALAERVNGIL